MLGPKSYTREDVVEVQCHGSEVCLRRVLRAFLEAGDRLAEPGEFTLRAFLNGRLDLSQAENVGKTYISQVSCSCRFCVGRNTEMGSDSIQNGSIYFGGL